MTGLIVRSVVVLPNSPDGFGRLRIELDRSGDDGPYVLAAVDSRDPTKPPAGFDVVYARREFRFTPAVAAEDCAPQPCTEPPPPPAPPIDYLAKDYASFRRLMLDRLARAAPGWTERRAADLGVALVEVLAYAADHLSYAQDAVATEAYLETARLRVSVRRHARLVDYRMHDGCNSRAWVQVQVRALVPAAGLTFFTEPGGPPNRPSRPPVTRREALEGPGERDRAVFEPIPQSVPLQLHPAQNRVPFYTWGDDECCLAAGATAASLTWNGAWTGDPGDREWVGPRVGDLLLIEEVLGPRTGNPADADPHHRHVVRLTRVEKALDRPPRPGRPAAEWEDVPVLEIGWDAADALPFGVCISTRGQHDVSVARGNVVLVDHGLTVVRDRLFEPHLPAGAAEPGPCAGGHPLLGPADQTAPPRRFGEATFRPPLVAPLTRATPYPDRATHARYLGRWLTRWLAARVPVRPATRKPAPATDDALAEAWPRGAGEPAEVKPALGAKGPPPGADKPAPPPGAVGGEAKPLDPLGAEARRLALGGVPDVRAVFGALPPWAGVIGPARFDLTPDARAAAAALELFELPPTGATDPDAVAAERQQQFKKYYPALGRQPNDTDLHNRADLTRWVARTDLLDSGPSDPHFVIEGRDDGTALVRFGDGRSGRRPAPGAAFLVRYRIGNGTAGNVGTDTIIGAVGPGADLVTAAGNPLPAGGGTDPEPTAQVKLLAPTAFRSVLARAITADDYARLAERDDRVQRAAATFSRTPTGTLVRIALDLRAAATAGAPDATAEVKRIRAEIEADLNRYRRIGHDVRVESAAEVPLFVRITVRAEPHADPGRVRAAVRAELAPGTRPNGRRGFFDPDELTFGQRIDASALVARVRAVTGVAAVELVSLRRRTGPSADAARTGFLRVGALEVPRVDADPVFPEFGELVIDVRGGGR